MDNNVNIYVADFKQNDIYNYKIIYNGPDYTDLDTWFKGMNITKINKGDIICIDGPDEVFEDGHNPAYIIAKKDYDEYDLSSYDNVSHDDIPQDLRDSVRIPRYVNGYVSGESQGKMSVDIRNNEFFPTNIWESCNPALPTANEQPWSFVTEGIVTDYISLQWNDSYNEVGNFKLMLPSSEENLELFQSGKYILIENSDNIMIIEKTTQNGNFLSDGYILQIYGRSLESILDRRVAFPGMDLDTLECKSDDGLINALYEVVNAYFINPEITMQVSNDGNKFFYYPERKIPFLEIPQENLRRNYIKRTFNASINKNIIKENILDFMSENCKNNNLGFKIVASPKYGNSRCISWTFILFTGEDKSYSRTDKMKPLLVFSPTLNNVKNISTTVDSSKYKNVIFCGEERDSDSFIDLAATPDVEENLLKINMPAIISNLKNQVVTHFQENPVTYTGEIILATAANLNDKSYTPTVKYFDVDGGIDTLSTFLNVYDAWDPNTGLPTHIITPPTDYEIVRERGHDYYRILKYPKNPISKSVAQKIDVVFYITNGQEYGFSNTDRFNISRIESNDDGIGFKQSTSSGWLTTTILKEATSGANSMSNDNSDGSPSWSSLITGLPSTVTKTAILLWFKTLDKYTGSGTTRTKWLCQLYDRSNNMSGLDRKEVFVERENNNDNEWDSSAINAFRQSTSILNVTSYQDDEDDDEKINEKLRESAKKQSGDYNFIRDVSVDVETDYFKYIEDYNLGDIVQVDDNQGNLDRYYISGTTIANDTTNGLTIVPNFTKYEIIPNSYMQVEYIRIANMILPIKYCPQENIINTEENTNYGEIQPDLGPKQNPNPVDQHCTYSGYIDQIIDERRSKWTEFELRGAYNIYEKPDGTYENLRSTFALISAVGYMCKDDYNLNCRKYLLPYALLSSNRDKPMTLGLSTGSSEAGNTTNQRYFYQFIGDYTSIYGYVYSGSGELLDVSKEYMVPGIGIKWDADQSVITTTNYLNAIYRVLDDSYVHTFYLNKAINKNSSGIDNRNMKYSYSYIDNDSNKLSLRPQFQFAFPLESGWYYRQDSEWNYGHPINPNINTDPNNDYSCNPWTRLASVGYTTLWDPHLEYDSGNMHQHDVYKYTQLNCEKFDQPIGIYSSRSYDEVIGGILPGEGAFGQITFDNSYYDFYTDANNPIKYQNIGKNITNNSNYRYVILGGCAYMTNVNNNWENIDKKIIWHSESNGGYYDGNNGLYLNELKVYEYESSYRIYDFSLYKLEDQDTNVDTYLCPWYGSANAPSGHPEITGDYPDAGAFRGARSASENVDLSSRKLVHDYIPVKYVDSGKNKVENVDAYGLYDLIDQRFIPVNFCPDPTVFGESTNSHAVFIDAGGEVPKY